MVFPCGLGLGAGLTFVIMGIKTINDEGAQEAVVMGAIFSLFWLPFTWAMFRAFIATIKLRWVLKDS